MIENTLLLNISVFLASLQIITMIYALITYSKREARLATLFVGILITINSLSMTFFYLGSEILSMEINPWLQTMSAYMMGFGFLYFSLATMVPDWLYRSNWARWLIIAISLLAPLGILSDISGFSDQLIGQRIFYKVPIQYGNVTGIILPISAVTATFLGNLFLYGQFALIILGVLQGIFNGLMQEGNSKYQRRMGTNLVVSGILVSGLLILNLLKILNNNAEYLLLQVGITFLATLIIILTGSYTRENYSILILRDNFLDLPMFRKLVVAVMVFLLPPLMFAGTNLALTNYNSALNTTITNLNAISELEVNSVLQALDLEVTKLGTLDSGTNLEEITLRYRDSLIGVTSENQMISMMEGYENTWQAALLESEIAIMVEDKGDAWMNIISQNETVASTVDPANTAILTNFMETNTLFFNMSVYDSVGGLVATATSDDYSSSDFIGGNAVLYTPLGVPDHFYVGEETWFQNTYFAGRGNVVIGDPQYDPRVDTYIARISIPLYNPQNTAEVMGVLSAQYNIQNIMDSIAGFAPGRTGAILLYDSNNDYLRPVFSDTLDVPFLDFAIFPANTQSWAVTEIYNNKSIVMVTPVESENFDFSTPWTIVTHIPVAESFSGVVDVIQTTALLILAIAAFSMLIILIMGNVIARPLVQLTNAAEQAAQGDYQIQVETRGKDEIGMLGQAFNLLTGDISTMIHELEGTVQERTQALERRNEFMRAASDVGLAATSIYNLDELLPRITQFISERFNFYHVGIFMLDSSGDYAVLRAANSEGGRRMLARGHRLQVGTEGLVGYVTQSGNPRIALNVGDDAVHFQNPDLPDTQSEMTLPLISGGRIFGALDVQSRDANAFSEDDLLALTVLANQVSMAINNSLLIQDLQSSVESERRAYGEVSFDSWRAMLRNRRNWGYRYSNQTMTPTTGAWTNLEVEAMRSGEGVQKRVGDRPTLAVPIKSNEKIIGVIRFEKPESESIWTQEEINALESITEQVGLTLETARLYNETQKRAAQEQIITQVSSSLRQSLDIDSILQTAVQQFGEALGAREVVIQIKDDNNNH